MRKLCEILAVASVGMGCYLAGYFSAEIDNGYPWAAHVPWAFFIAGGACAVLAGLAAECFNEEE